MPVPSKLNNASSSSAHASDLRSPLSLPAHSLFPLLSFLASRSAPPQLSPRLVSVSLPRFRSGFRLRFFASRSAFSLTLPLLSHRLPLPSAFASLRRSFRFAFAPPLGFLPLSVSLRFLRSTSLGSFPHCFPASSFDSAFGFCLPLLFVSSVPLLTEGLPLSRCRFRPAFQPFFRLRFVFPPPISLQRSVTHSTPFQTFRSLGFFLHQKQKVF